MFLHRSAHFSTHYERVVYKYKETIVTNSGQRQDDGRDARHNITIEVGLANALAERS